MELLLLLEGRFSAKSKSSHQAWEGAVWERKLQQECRAQNALEKGIISHIHLLINFYERLSPALNPQQFIIKKDVDTWGWGHELTPTLVMN